MHWREDAGMSLDDQAEQRTIIQAMQRAPHAAGVAALAVGTWGFRDRRNGGKFAFPGAVEWFLRATAADTPCPTPPAFTYTRILPSEVTVTTTHECEGTRDNNGIYGDGIVDAKRVARGF